MTKLQKPIFGQPCNGCGLCCLITQCPVSLLLFGEEDRCPALEESEARFSCGLVSNPAHYFDRRPEAHGKRIGQWLGTGDYCDSVHGLTDAIAREILADELMARFPTPRLEEGEAQAFVHSFVLDLK